MNFKSLTWPSLAVLVAGSVFGWNYFDVHTAAAKKIAEDPRNAKISMWVYHRYGVLPREVVMDLRGFDGAAAPLDVIRVLLHGAHGLKDKQFDRVVLAYKGTPKFYLEGAYFKALGLEWYSESGVHVAHSARERAQA